jgi:hypothetical protein
MDNTENKQFKRIVNPSVLKLTIHKCTSNQNQTLQWRAVNSLKYAVNAIYPNSVLIMENDEQIRLVVDTKGGKKPSLWHRIKFLIKG